MLGSVEIDTQDWRSLSMCVSFSGASRASEMEGVESIYGVFGIGLWDAW